MVILSILNKEMFVKKSMYSHLEAKRVKVNPIKKQ